MSEKEDLENGLKGIKLLEKKVGVIGLVVKSSFGEVDYFIIKTEVAKKELEKELTALNNEVKKGRQDESVVGE